MLWASNLSANSLCSFALTFDVFVLVLLIADIVPVDFASISIAVGAVEPSCLGFVDFLCLSFDIDVTVSFPSPIILCISLAALDDSDLSSCGVLLSSFSLCRSIVYSLVAIAISSVSSLLATLFLISHSSLSLRNCA